MIFCDACCFHAIRLTFACQELLQLLTTYGRRRVKMALWAFQMVLTLISCYSGKVQSNKKITTKTGRLMFTDELTSVKKCKP